MCPEEDSRGSVSVCLKESCKIESVRLGGRSTNRDLESVCLAESSAHLTERVLVVEDQLLR